MAASESPAISIDLVARWDALAPKRELHHWITSIVQRYEQPHRSYHTTAHLCALLAGLDAVAGSHHVRDKSAIEFAIFFHDVVYDTKASDNELRSAKLWRKFCWEAALPEDKAAAVEAFIMATAGHARAGAEAGAGPQAAGDLALFLDLDLAVLGQPRERYLAYAGQIRQEYIWVEEERYRAKRAEVLRGLLAAPKLYRTAAFSDLEQPARANMEFELAELQAGRIPPVPRQAGIPLRCRLFIPSVMAKS